MNTLETARYYLKKGFSVIPLMEKDKKPAIPWKKYQSRKPTGNELVRWFGNGSRKNIGIVTGKISGIVVLDLDSEKALKLAQKNGLPTTPMVETGKGYHAYLQHKEGARNFQKRADLPEIDFRGEGGFIVAPPSIHESGIKYSWMDGKRLDDLPLADLPHWVLEERLVDKAPTKECYEGVPEGKRNDTLARLVGKWSRGGLNLSECKKMACLWNEKNNPPLTDKEVERTVKSIFDRHMRQVASQPHYWTENISYYYFKPLGGRLVKTIISNFIIEMDKEVEVFDGYDNKRKFEGKIRGSGWNRYFKLDAKSFFNDNKLREAIGEQAGARAQFKPENVKHIRLASQKLSKIKQESVLKQFGWRDDKTFLTPAVIITKDGVAENSEIKVDLSEAENAKHLNLQILDNGLFEKVARHILNDLMPLHPPDVVYPLIGHAFIAPVMKFQNDTTRYVLWLKGITGCGKSFIARLFQCFFGLFIEDNTITSWTSTTNFIQMVGFYFKDAIFLVDDFKKGNIKNRNDLIQKLQTYADGTGRGRLNADSTTKQTRPILGLMLCTGEDVPEHEASILARILIVDFSNTEKDIEKGKRCLEYRKYYSGIMAKYIHWIISKDIKPQIKQLVQKHMDLFYQGIEGQLNDIRIARNLALNFTGFRLFCNFLQDAGIITEDENERMWKHALSILLSIRERQIETVKDEQGSNIFLDTLSELIGTGRVSIEGHFAGENKLSPGVGFTKAKDDPFVYINTITAYAEVQKVIVQGGGSLNLSKNAIGKQLCDDGLLHKMESGRTTKRIKHKKSTHRVWILKKEDVGIE